MAPAAYTSSMLRLLLPAAMLVASVAWLAPSPVPVVRPSPSAAPHATVEWLELAVEATPEAVDDELNGERAPTPMRQAEPPAAPLAPGREAAAPAVQTAVPIEAVAPPPLPAAPRIDQPPPAVGATDLPAAEADLPCSGEQPAPLPRPGDPRAAEFFARFRDPLPRVPRWNPPGPRRVGLQAGHWLTEQTPPELGRLQHGSSGGGKAEWEVNLDLAQRAKRWLEAAGVEVDVLPTTVPPRYRAHVFVSIHADGDLSGRLRGFKIARPGFSSVPEEDDRLVEALYQAYGAATGLPRDDAHISRRMIYYYAFNSRRFCHAVAPGVPQAIIETGFLTSALDRQVLLGNPEAAARGIANGILAFLAN